MRGADDEASATRAPSAPDGTKLADLDGKIVECASGQRRGASRKPARGSTRVGTDKDAPNIVTVCRHTLMSILDDITDAEIISYVGGVLAEGRGWERGSEGGREAELRR